jgi:AAA15 family ATPase/GTPase
MQNVQDAERKATLMLVEFRVQNFGCIKEEIKLSMSANSKSEYAFESKHKLAEHLLPTAGIFGPNASGKSTLMRAIDFFNFLVHMSDSFEKDQTFNITPFLLDKKTKSQPSEFEVTFIHNDTLYQYGSILDSERILEEWMYMVPHDGRKNEVFTRVYNSKNEEYEWVLNDKLIKGPKASWRQATAKNSLFLSTANRLNAHEHTPAFKDTYDWFKSKLQQMIRPNRTAEVFTAELFYNENKMSQNILNFIRDADIDISNIKVSKRDDEVLKDLPDKVKERFRYSTSFGHIDNNGEEVFWDFNHESDGTQMLFTLLGPLMETLEEGGIILIDELHNHMHPFVLEKVISLFQNKKTNKNNAQLIFTSHDFTPMDPKILGKDQIWLTQKGKDKSTELISLSSFKELRNDSIFWKYYIAGRLGSVPNIKEATD